MSTSQAIRFETKPAMSLYELSGTVEFDRLSQKQGMWVLTYLQQFLDTGEFEPTAATRATQSVYNCKNDESARILGFQLKANSKINSVLNRFFGDSPEQSFLKQVERATHKKKLSVAEIEALKLYSDLQGWTTGSKWAVRRKHQGEPEDSPTAEPPIKFYVGQLVTQRDGKGVLHTGRVMAIDPDGEPTIEEIL